MTRVENHILRILPDFAQKIYRRHMDIFRFIIIGGLATIIHYIAALFTHHIFGFTPLWANFIAFCIAFNATYIGNYFWVFQAATDHKTSFMKSAVVSLTGLALSQVIVWILTEKGGLSFHITLIIAVMLVPMVTFSLNRFWVFKAP